MMKSKAILPFLAIALCMGVFFFPITSYAQVSDATPPAVTAEVSGDTLIVQAKDDDSGVEAIYVGEHPFSTLVNGAASIKLSDYAGESRQITIYAVDAAGNRSQPVLINNPHYVEPTPASTPVPSAPMADPASSSATEAALPEPVMPENTVVDEQSDAGVGVTQSAITGQAPFTPEGEGTVVDNATEEDGKEFFTVTATDGSVYYLVIDRQRGTENVYFLSAVTTDDLVSLAEDRASTESSIAQPMPEPIESEIPEDDTEQQEESAQSGDNTGTIIFVLLAVAVVGGAGYYIKVVKPRRQARQDDEEEYEDDFGDETEGDEYLFDGETDEYYPGEPGTEGTVDNNSTARYNDTTNEKAD